MRASWIEIDLEQIRKNVRFLKSRTAPGAKFMGVVKGDGYGCGAIPVANILAQEGADCFAVALVQEGVELRNAAGELKQYKFKNVQRNVYNGGKISEYAVITMFNHSDEFITVTDVDKLRAFIGGADITGRALAERSVFYFVPVEIIYK
jgi:alanine racemase